jgi:hypothetical protein
VVREQSFEFLKEMISTPGRYAEEKDPMALPCDPRRRASKLGTTHKRFYCIDFKYSLVGKVIFISESFGI